MKNSDPFVAGFGLENVIFAEGGILGVLHGWFKVGENF